MTSEKSVPLSFRVSPGVKALLVAAAAAENRSLTNMLETLVISHCQRTGLQARTAPAKSRGDKR
jgi:uncharacterized protein (DUF1778 family)